MADGIEQAGHSIAEGILSAAQQMRQNEEMRVKALLEAGKTHPEILDDPNVYKTIRGYTRDDATAKALISSSQAKSLPGQALTTLGAIGVPEQAIRQTVAPGSVPLPQGEPGPVQPAPSQTQLGQAALGALPELAQQKGFGVSIGPSGISVKQSPPTRSEAGEQAGLQAWDTARTELLNAGLPPEKADTLGARLTLSAMARSGQIPPSWMRDMALAETQDSLAAARERAVKDAGAQVERENAASIASEKARGQVTGKAAGEAAIPFQTMSITKPDGTKIDIPLTQAGAYAATGEPTAVTLGRNPSKTQLEAAAQTGADLFTGPNGDLIQVPIGHAPTLDKVPASNLIMGSEAIKMLAQVKGVVDGLTDPKFLKLFPSEAKDGRERARAAGYAQSWVRGLSDPADALAKRGELRQLGFRLARLFGSNSQLSDAERENAQKVLQPVIDGTATQEQIIEAQKSLNRFIAAATSRPGAPASAAPAPAAPAAPKPAAAAPKEQGTSLGDKQNNPGHVKATAFTRRLPGYVGEGKAAKDGGKFAIFDSPESGRAAIESVLTRIHGTKSIATALSQYSGGGYDVKRVAMNAGVDPKQSVASLTPEQRSTLVDSMIEAEGSSTGLSREGRAARLAAKVNSGKLKAEDAARMLRQGG